MVMVFFEISRFLSSLLHITIKKVGYHINFALSKSCVIEPYFTETFGKYFWKHKG
jgi:hypothetical protein